MRDKVVKYVNIEKDIIEFNDNTTLTFQDLVIAIGARPIIPNINGVGYSNIYTVRTYKDFIGFE